MDGSRIYIVGVEAPDRQRMLLRDRADANERRAVPRNLETGAALRTVGDFVEALTATDRSFGHL